MPLNFADIPALVAALPSIKSIVEKATAKIKEAEIDGKVSGEEIGGILAAIGPDLGKLVDELIAAAKD